MCDGVRESGCVDVSLSEDVVSDRQEGKRLSKRKSTRKTKETYARSLSVEEPGCRETRRRD